MKRPNKTIIAKVAFCIMSLLCILWIPLSRSETSTNEFSGIYGYMNTGESIDLLERENESGISAWSLINDSDFYRIENDSANLLHLNSPLISDQSSTAYYWSLINPNVVEFINLNSAFSENDFLVNGLSSRSLLLPLASTKYYVHDLNLNATIPYPFTEIYSDEQYAIYETEYSLPFGYTYDSLINISDFYKMSLVERQQAMLQGAVVDEDSETALELLPACIPEFTDQTLPYKANYDGTTTFTDNTYTTNAPNSQITFDFNCPENSELYVQFEGLKFLDSSLESSIKKQAPSTDTTIVASSDKNSDHVVCYTPYHIYAKGRNDYLLNLGYSDQERHSLTLTLSKNGEYIFDSFSIICQPMKNLDEQITELRKDDLKDVEIDTNHIRGSIALDDRKLLCLSIPFSEGWAAFDNGQPIETIRTNIMFTGIMLEAGEHNIVLKYETPYFNIGLIVSIISLLVLILLSFHNRTGSVNRRKARSNMD